MEATTKRNQCRKTAWKTRCHLWRWDASIFFSPNDVLHLFFNFLFDSSSLRFLAVFFSLDQHRLHVSLRLEIETENRCRGKYIDKLEVVDQSRTSLDETVKFYLSIAILVDMLDRRIAIAADVRLHCSMKTTERTGLKCSEQCSIATEFPFVLYLPPR